MNQTGWMKRGRTVPRMMADVVLALAALSILPAASYGARVVVLLLSGVLAAVLVERTSLLLLRKGDERFDGAAVVTGMIIALLLPANVPIWMPAVGSAFAVVAAKTMFGGTGRNLLNPAAVGVAFLTICWPDQVFGYCTPQWLPIFQNCAVSAARSPCAFLRAGLKPEILPHELLWGQYPGPMGTGFAVVIAACAIFLILRREAVWYVPVAFLGTAAVLSALFPRLALAPIDSIKYELLSGSMLFCAAFLLNDPVTSPRTGVGRVCYAALGGLAVMLLRWLGPYEESAVFGVLLVNLLSPLLDWLVCFLRQKRLRKAEENLRRGAA